jgi:hypothetical protein
MNKHDHKSKPAPRTSLATELPGRPSVISHDDNKSVHTHRSPGRSHPKTIGTPADREIGEGHAGGAPAPGSNTAGWVPPATGNPSFAPNAGVQAALYYERKANRSGRKPLG